MDSPDFIIDFDSINIESPSSPRLTPSTGIHSKIPFENSSVGYSSIQDYQPVALNFQLEPIFNILQKPLKNRTKEDIEKLIRYTKSIDYFKK